MKTWCCRGCDLEQDFSGRAKDSTDLLEYGAFVGRLPRRYHAKCGTAPVSGLVMPPNKAHEMLRKDYIQLTLIQSKGDR